MYVLGKLKTLKEILKNEEVKEYKKDIIIFKNGNWRTAFNEYIGKTIEIDTDSFTTIRGEIFFILKKENMLFCYIKREWLDIDVDSLHIKMLEDDTPIRVSMAKKVWFNRYYKANKDEKIITYPDGATSWSSKDIFADYVEKWDYMCLDLFPQYIFDKNLNLINENKKGGESYEI